MTNDILIFMVAVQDYTWEQGDDLIIEIVYKINDVPVDLSNHSVRMDIAPVTGATVGSPVWSFNSEDLSGSPLDTEGIADNEAVLDAQGNIHIRVPRDLTLTGVIGAALPTTTTYAYDLFLRDKGANTQKKLLRGNITVNRSITHWA